MLGEPATLCVTDSLPSLELDNIITRRTSQIVTSFSDGNQLYPVYSYYPVIAHDRGFASVLCNNLDIVLILGYNYNISSTIMGIGGLSLTAETCTSNSAFPCSGASRLVHSVHLLDVTAIRFAPPPCTFTKHCFRRSEDFDAMSMQVVSSSNGSV